MIVATPIAPIVAPCIHYRQPVGAMITPTVVVTIAPCKRPISCLVDLDIMVRGHCQCKVNIAIVNFMVFVPALVGLVSFAV